MENRKESTGKTEMEDGGNLPGTGSVRKGADLGYG